jgi:hypothetical protein
LPALDRCHPQVVHALEKAGWTVLPKPYALYLNRAHRLHIDIETIRNSGTASQSIIVVEVKCFDDEKTETGDLYTAVGQYLVYQGLLHQKGIVTPLYLGFPKPLMRASFSAWRCP